MEQQEKHLNKKPKILFVNESSTLATGFSTYGHEVLKRLYSMNEFDIAEIGAYVDSSDPRNDSVPWNFYPVIPDRNNQEAFNAHNSDIEAQFGKQVFDKVCLKEHPDIVCGIRDPWMDMWINDSVFRKHFAFFWMATIDGLPQKRLWIDHYKRCDKLFTYSNWAKDLIKNDLEADDVISPGVNLNVFKPIEDKGLHKKRSGIDPDTFIIGMVARNQKRKLFYDLIEAYAEWFNKSKACGYAHIASKTYLYLHTSYPDVGYDIARAIAEFKVGNRVLMTYMCRACGAAYPSFFAGAKTTCKNPNCRQNEAHLPNANSYVPQETLAHIYNLFDIYVQYSICEGFGMPIQEAAACGLPRMCVDYSAMKDHLAMPGGIPIRVGRYFYESMQETEQKRALPDNEHFGKQLTLFLKKSKDEKAALSKKIRDFITEKVETPGKDGPIQLERCGWDRTAALWAHYFRTFPIKNHAMTWECPIPLIHNVNCTIPGDLNNLDFVNFAIEHVLARKELIGTSWAKEWAKALNSGVKFEGVRAIGDVNKEYVLNYFYNMRQNINNAEIQRVNQILDKNGQNNKSINISVM